MDQPLLATKLYIPSQRPNLISRPHLTERLDSGLDCKLTLISAPAGFGKTTLLIDWLQENEQPVAWVSLDEGDNDQVRFLTYVIAALQSVHSEIGAGTLIALQSPQAPPIEATLTTLINEIANVNGRFLLVLDDYHVIESQEIDHALTFLLDHLPPQTHLVIASRVIPSLPLARLRASSEMNELRTDDLRFTPEEVADFLHKMLDLEVSNGDVAALENHTEGWIAGLQLAALSMQQLGRCKEVSRFIADFTGSHRYILDYLTDEVLAQCPPDTTDFLLSTSILRRMSGPLCNAVTGGSDGQATLKQLDNANMFMVPLDNKRHWYRYHHLFADLLKQRLQRTRPDEIDQLHHRASQWYEQNNLVKEALDHALAASDFDRAARLVAENAQTMFANGEVSTVREWFQALPPETVRNHPRLCIDQAWVFYFTHRPNAIEPFLKEAEKGLSRGEFAHPETISVWRGEVIGLRAWIERCHGNLEKSIQLSQQALDLLTEKEMFVRCLNILCMADSLCSTGSSIQAAEALSDCVCSCQQAGSPLGVVAGAYDLAELLVRQGHLRQAKTSLQQALAWAADQGVNQLPATAPLHIGLGEILREQNDFEAAEDHLITGLELAELGYKTISGQGYLALAHLKLTRGDFDGAQETFQEAERAMRGWETPLMQAYLAAHRVHLWLLPERGNLSAAVQWAEKQQLDLSPSEDDAETGLSRIVRLITVARVRIAQARRNADQKGTCLDGPLNLLERVDQTAQLDDRMGRLIDVSVLQALIFGEQGQIDNAMAALERALSLGEPEGYCRIFVDEGDAMARLLYRAGKRNIAPDYAGRLLAAFDQPQEKSSPSGAESTSQLETNGLIEPLTKRQVEVLELVAQGLSNQKIAQELTISVNTVKGHTRKIYRKLGVNSRTQATAKASAFGILSLD